MDSELIKALVQLNTALVSMLEKTELEKALEEKDDYPQIVPYPC